MEPDNDLFTYFVEHEFLVRSGRMNLDEEVAYQASKWTLLHPYFPEWKELYQQPPRGYWDFMNRVNAEVEHWMQPVYEAWRRRDETIAAVLKQRDEAIAATRKQRDEALKAMIQKNNQEQSNED